MRKFNELEAERQADVARLLVSPLSFIDRDIVEGSLEAGEFDQAVEESAELARYFDVVVPDFVFEKLDVLVSDFDNRSAKYALKVLTSPGWEEVPLPNQR